MYDIFSKISYLYHIHSSIHHLRGPSADTLLVRWSLDRPLAPDGPLGGPILALRWKSPGPPVVILLWWTFSGCTRTTWRSLAFFTPGDSREPPRSPWEPVAFGFWDSPPSIACKQKPVLNTCVLRVNRPVLNTCDNFLRKCCKNSSEF